MATLFKWRVVVAFEGSGAVLFLEAATAEDAEADARKQFPAAKSITVTRETRDPPFRFMGEQEDPELERAVARAFPRIYDGTKRSLLDDVHGLLTELVDWARLEPRHHDRANELLKRIDGGER